jgi:hypothetical protein
MRSHQRAYVSRLACWGLGAWVLATSTACASTLPKVTPRASRDLECAQERVIVEDALVLSTCDSQREASGRATNEISYFSQPFENAVRSGDAKGAVFRP